MQNQFPVTRTAHELRQRVVVLPLQPAAGESFDGTGLFLHFLLGNVLALHTGLEEFWFGWRAQKIFTEPQALRNFCRNAATPLDIPRVAEQQDVRYWLAGHVERGAVPLLRLQLTDAYGPPKQWETVFTVAPEDKFVGLRQGFFEWLSSCGLPFPPEQASRTLWPEESDIEGMQRLGVALETFYCNGYEADPSHIDLRPFEGALAAAPDSYLALDLLGWARYRRQNHAVAREAFAAALEINPYGAGVLSGLMRCAVQAGDEEDAYRWAESLASLRGGSPEQQKAAAAHLLAKNARKRGDDRMAVALYRKATAWDPAKRLYADGLTAAVQACDVCE